MTGTLHLVPNSLGPGDLPLVLPDAVLRVAARLDYFVGENAKSTRAFLKRVATCVPLARPIQEIEIAELGVSTPASALPALLAPLLAGRDAGLVSEAGCPAVADPGAALVRLAHRHGVVVAPLVGPSAILLAVMAGGLDGQRFAFNGYLPSDAGQRTGAIRDAEQRSLRRRQTQVFIETPYRNMALFAALVEQCRPDTLLSVACDLTLPSQWISTREISAWRAIESKESVDLAKRPTIFSLLAAS